MHIENVENDEEVPWHVQDYCYKSLYKLKFIIIHQNCDHNQSCEERDKEEYKLSEDRSLLFLNGFTVQSLHTFYQPDEDNYVG